MRFHRGMPVVSFVAMVVSMSSPAAAQDMTALYSRLSAAGLRQLHVLRGESPVGTVTRQLRAPQRLETSIAVDNVLVNDPSLDLGESSTQNEVSMAVAGNTICVGYNDTGDPEGSTSGFSRSENLGVSWEDRGGIGDFFHFGDPVVAVHRASGTFYFADLALEIDAIDGVRSMVSVARSTDDCRTFTEFANASPDGSRPRICAAPASSFCANRNCRENSDCDSSRGAGDGICSGRDAEDKPWMTVDNSGGAFDGNVYACWSRFVGGSSNNFQGTELRVSRSQDGGRTFEEQRVSSGDEFPLGCFLAVGPGGEVYVAWADNIDRTPIRFRRSLDGGATWEAIVQVNRRITRYPGGDRVITCNTGMLCGEVVENVRPTLTGDVRQAAQVWMATDTTASAHRGNVYAVWMHDPPGLPDNSDVMFARSLDGGLTWSPEIQLGGGSPTDQFEPFIAVAGDGTVSVSWYDRRNDPVNNFLIDVYAVLSRDGGATFEPLVRLTDDSFPVPPLTGQQNPSGNFDPVTSGCYMGEYNAATADATHFYYAWGDNRNRRFTALYPAGRPDPDVFFTRLPVAAPGCVGDCDVDGDVTVDEILVMVNIALGDADIALCQAADADGNGAVTVDEIVAALSNALEGCG
jgi:hypothetical protein